MCIATSATVRLNEFIDFMCFVYLTHFDLGIFVQTVFSQNLQISTFCAKFKRMKLQTLLFIAYNRFIYKFQSTKTCQTDGWITKLCYQLLLIDELSKYLAIRRPVLLLSLVYKYFKGLIYVIIHYIIIIKLYSILFYVVSCHVICFASYKTKTWRRF